MTALVLFLLLTPVAAWAIHRDLKRADARRRFRLKVADLRRDYEALQVAIGKALMPAMAGVATAAKRAAEAFSKFGWSAEDAAKFKGDA